MFSYITQFNIFWKTILSCLPSPILTYFYVILSIFIIAIFAKLIINAL